MKRFLISLLVISLMLFNSAYAEDKKLDKNPAVKTAGYTVEVTVKDIPKGQQTLFIPIKLDNSIVDVDMVSINDLAASNILAISSDSKGMSGSGIGLVKFDDNGLPETLMLNVSLNPVSTGTSEIEVFMLLDEPALPAKGLTINKDVKVNLKSNDEIEVAEKLVKGKKKLQINQNKITFEVHRQNQKEETIFIPVVFDKSIVDLDESFGHAILGQGIAAKTYSAFSLNNEGGSGVEIVLSPDAEKDFTVDIDLTPKGVGKAKILFALPQSSKTAIVKGPTVEFNPAVISVNKK